MSTNATVRELRDKTEQRHVFTLDQANRSLPLVQRVVTDIVAEYGELRSLFDQLVDTISKEQVEREIGRHENRVRELLKELREVGCELKDPAVGLVDFIGRHQNHDVYLCWRLGESRIDNWHEIQDGFAGRKPVSLLDEH